MKNGNPRESVADVACALRLTVLSLIVLGGIYPSLLTAFGNVVAPFSSQGSLIRNAEGTVVGSVLIAQNFTRPAYFWPRPSAANYDAAAAGGSNLPPSSPELKKRIKERIRELGGTAEHPVPVELLAASGSGLDPHLFPAAVAYQSDRVAAARGLDSDLLRRWVEEWIGPRALRRRIPLVNVLQLNIALDERFGPPPAAEKSGRTEEAE